MYEALLPVVRTRQTKQKNTDTLTTTETNRKVRRTWHTQRSEDEDALSFPRPESLQESHHTPEFKPNTVNVYLLRTTININWSLTMLPNTVRSASRLV